MVPRALRSMFRGALFRWGVRAGTPENDETLPSSRRANEEEGRVSLSLSGCERLVQPGEKSFGPCNARGRFARKRFNMNPAGFPRIHAGEECGDPRALEISSVKFHP